MTTALLRPISRWLIGLCVGTLVVAITSPLFVRSYLPLVIDPVRDTWTMQPDRAYRWRSEGYATTHIGPHGMPGRTDLPATSDHGGLRIALWGDSQAEGVAVNDSDKLFAATESPVQAAVLPFARSGEDANAWLPQMRAVEASFDVDLHVFLIVEWQDLAIAAIAPDQTPMRSRAGLAAVLPAFVIQAARNLLREADGATPRRLRWTIGPERRPGSAPPAPPRPVDWDAVMNRLQDVATVPILLVHAPRLPEIVGGRVVERPARPDVIADMKKAAERAGIASIDAGPVLIEAGRSGRWPHGFHNGQIGVGHLNRVGYERIAAEIARWIRRAGLKHSSRETP